MQSQVHRGHVWLALIGACSLSGLAAYAQETTLRNPAKLDMPVTPANSVRVDFGNGAILRIPKILIDPSLVPQNPMQPVKLEQIFMVFQFPDMVETVYPSPMAIIFEKQAGRYVRKPDTFPVYIKWLFHSEETLDHDWAMERTPITIWESKWRPATNLEGLAINIKESAAAHHVADNKLTFSDAKYQGLREVHIPVTDPEYKARSEAAWRKSGWDGKPEVLYVAQVGSPYELYMECDPVDSVNSSKCVADVYIKRSHFQYHMTFPPEAVAHSDQLIRTVNKMIEGWTKK